MKLLQACLRGVQAQNRIGRNAIIVRLDTVLAEEIKAINMFMGHCSLQSGLLTSLVRHHFSPICELETDCANR